MIAQNFGNKSGLLPKFCFLYAMLKNEESEEPTFLLSPSDFNYRMNKKVFIALPPVCGHPPSFSSSIR